jgi:DNA-binding NarL/FixJ family response regulator
MITRRQNSTRTELTDEAMKQRKSGQFGTRILVVDDHPNMRQGLIQLINQEADLGVCLEAESTAQAWNVVDKQQVDMAIVDVSPGRAKDLELIEKMRLQCPSIPILILTAHSEAVNTGRVLEGEAGRYFENQEVREKIIKAIRYVQSLLRTEVHGFTILVKV